MVRNNQVLSTKNIDTQFTKTNQNITLDSVINIMKIGNDKQTKIKISFPFTNTENSWACQEIIKKEIKHIIFFLSWWLSISPRNPGLVLIALLHDYVSL